MAFQPAGVVWMDTMVQPLSNEGLARVVNGEPVSCPQQSEERLLAGRLTTFESGSAEAGAPAPVHFELHIC